MTANSEKRKPPKGGAKGGTRFPRITLEKAIQYASKLVSKTHTGPLAKEIIKAGVFNHSGGQGTVRISALKQYGLLEETDGLIQASKDAKEIVATPKEELTPFLQRAFLFVKLFDQVYKTYKGDTVNLARIKQFGIKADVHPDSADLFVDVVTKSLVYCGLATVEGEDVSLGLARASMQKDAESAGDVVDDGDEVLMVESDKNNLNSFDDEPIVIAGKSGAGPLNISLTLDSTMDSEKLEKMLKVLKQYGAI